MPNTAEARAPEPSLGQSARDDAKRVVVEIVRAAGRRMNGRVRLFKAFYAAHLFYWEKGLGTLTDHPIVHMPNGPGIDNGDAIIAELEEEGRLSVTERMVGPYKEDVFSLTPTSVRSVSTLDSNQAAAIRDAVAWVKGKTASQLSAETHALSRSWNATCDGAEMNVYLDALSEAEFERIRKNVNRAEERVRAAFADET